MRSCLFVPLNAVLTMWMEQHLLLPSASILISSFSIHCLINILFCRASLSLSLSLNLPPLVYVRSSNSIPL